nr:MAG TPA: hypothetical protein [Caudoviricetes sp.]
MNLLQIFSVIGIFFYQNSILVVKLFMFFFTCDVER